MLWPLANVKTLTHPSAVAREFPSQWVPKGGAQLTLGPQIDGRGHGPKRVSQQPYTLTGAGGSQPPGRKLGWWVSPGRGGLPTLAPHPAPPFQEARRPGIPRGCATRRVCDLGQLLFFLSLSSPPHNAGSGSDIPGVPCSARPLSTRPHPLSSTGVSPESGPDRVRLQQQTGGVPEVTQSELKPRGDYLLPHILCQKNEMEALRWSGSAPTPKSYWWCS